MSLSFQLKKTLGLECSGEDYDTEPRHGRREAGFLERPHSGLSDSLVPAEGSELLHVWFRTKDTQRSGKGSGPEEELQVLEKWL